MDRGVEILPPIEQTINCVVIYNPLDPTDRQQDKIVWRKEATVADYLDGLPDIDNWQIAVNGRMLEDDEFEVTKVDPDEFLIIAPIPRGGGKGGAKQIVRLVAMLAIAAVATYIAGPAGLGLSGTVFGGAITTTQLFVGAVTTLAGAVFSAFAPAPKQPSLSSPDVSQQDYADSPSYGIDGAKNTSREDAAVGVVYGTFRVGGNRAHIVAENDGKSQYIRIQQIISEGPIQSISQIQAEGQPIENYKDTKTEVRLGTSDQNIVGWFDDSTTMISRGPRLTDTFTYYDSYNDVDKLRFDFAASSGLVEIIKSSGNRRTRTVPLTVQYCLATEANEWTVISGTQTLAGAKNFEVTVVATKDNGAGATDGTYRSKVEYRKVGDTAWIQLGLQNRPVNERSGEIRVTFTSPVLAADQYEFQVITGTLDSARESTADWLTVMDVGDTKTEMSGATRTAIRRSYETDLLVQGRYRTRVRRDNEDLDSDFISDDVQWTDLAEIVADDVQYNFTAFFAVEIRLSGQLSRLPNLTALVEGRILDIYDLRGTKTASTFTGNCAWVLVDMLMNKLYGAGYDANRLDWPKFVEWAEYCDEKTLEFNGIFDYHTNLWEAMQTVFRIGRAQIVFVGTKVSLVIDKPSEVEMMYTSANIIKGSFGIEWAPLEDRANEIDITYFDKEDHYKQKTVRMTDFEELAKGKIRKSTSFTLLGMTSLDQVNFYANQILQQNKLTIQTVTFEAPLEGIASGVGSVITVQHEMPDWGTGGRLEAVQTTTVLNLDTPVDMEAGKSYRCLVHQSALKRWDAKIEIMGATSVFVSGITDSSLRVLRAIAVDGTDIEILQVVSGSPYYEVILDYIPASMNVLDNLELWDTDAIEERDVVLEVGQDLTQITLTSALSQVPVIYSNYMFGELNKIKKPFRIYSISRDGEFTRQIQAIEYVPEVYTDPTNVPAQPNYSTLDLTMGHVGAVYFEEELLKIGGGFRTRLLITWEIPTTGLYEGAEVFVARSQGEIYESIGSVRGGATGFSWDPPVDGEIIDFKVMPFDGVGGRPKITDATIYTHTVVGKIADPEQVANFTIKKALGGLDMAWSAVSDIDVVGYEIREGISWDAGTVVVELTQATRLLLPKEKSGTFNYHIKAVDVLGNRSQTPTSVSLTLPNPATVVGFMAVQSDRLVLMNWSASTEEDIYGYEIREGVSWGASALLTKIQATQFSTPIIGNDDKRTFWIKAYDVVGIASTTPVFAFPKVAVSQTKNIVYLKNETAGGFAGSRKFMSDVADGIILDANSQKGEYLFGFELAEERFARCTIQDTITLVIPSSKTWEDADFTWDSAAAQIPWLELGDQDDMSIARELSLEVGTTSSLEALSLNDITSGVKGLTATVETNVQYTKGNSYNAVLLGANTALSYSQAIPSEFNWSMWVRIMTIDVPSKYMKLSNGLGDAMGLVFDPVSGEFQLTDSLSNILRVPIAALPGDDFLVGVSQGGSVRQLIIGNISGGVFSSNDNFAPVGAFTQIDLGVSL